MGLLDRFTNLDDTQNQGLLAAAAQMLQQSGPSRTPTSFGQVLGGGLSAYQDSTIEAKRRKMQEDQMAQQKLLMGLQIQDKQSDFANQEAARTRASGLQSLSKDFFSRSPQDPALAAIAKMNGPTVENAAQLGQVQAQAPAQGQPSRFDSRMGWADHLRKNGYNTEAEAEEKSALAFQPKVKNWQEVRQGSQVLYAPFFEDGTAGQPVPLEIARKLEKVDSGQSTDMVDSYTGKVQTSIKKKQTLESMATERTAAANRNQSASQFNERLNFDRQQPRGTIIQTDQGPMLADPRAGTARPVTGPDGQPVTRVKPLPASIVKQVQEARDSAVTMDRLQKTFADGFGGKGVLGFGADAQMGMAGTLGTDQKSVAWWKDYRKQAELTERHALFGASLTPGEQASWRSADISPGMSAETIKTNLASRAALTKKVLSATTDDMIDAGHNPDRIRAIGGREAVESRAKPAAAPTMAAMPTANASNKGKTIKDHETGKRYQSNGMQWKEVP